MEKRPKWNAKSGYRYSRNLNSATIVWTYVFIYIYTCGKQDGCLAMVMYLNFQREPSSVLIVCGSRF